MKQFRVEIEYVMRATAYVTASNRANATKLIEGAEWDALVETEVLESKMVGTLVETEE